jgi:hypothetical protein
MKLARTAAILLGVLLCAGANAQPTQEEIQQDYDGQKYQDVLKKVASVLSLKGNAAQGYDRVALYKLKAESHLRLKQNAPAIEAFTNAAKEATDAKIAGECNALALLVKRSPGGRYTPKQPLAGTTGKPAPIDILNLQTRKDAMAALFNDESKPALAKVESLKKQKALKPVMDGIRDLSTLRALELAATESDAATKQAISQLGSHANQLMADALKNMSTKVEQIATNANKTTNSQQTLPDGRVEVVINKQGLNSTDKAALKDVIATCTNIGTACDEFVTALGSDGSGFAGTKGQSDQLGKRAEEVLNANYDPDVKSTGSVTVPGTPTRPPAGRYR